MPDPNDLCSRPAVRNGDKFCAPWCGRGCTVDEHDRARTGAAHLAADLYNATGLAWQGEMWENFGWHYRAILGQAQVNPNRFRDEGPVSYTCIVNSAGGVSVVERGDTPAEAFENARTALRAKLIAIGRDLAVMGGL